MTDQNEPEQPAPPQLRSFGLNSRDAYAGAGYAEVAAVDSRRIADERADVAA